MATQSGQHNVSVVVVGGGGGGDTGIAWTMVGPISKVTVIHKRYVIRSSPRPFHSLAAWHGGRPESLVATVVGMVEQFLVVLRAIK